MYKNVISISSINVSFIPIIFDAQKNTKLLEHDVDQENIYSVPSNEISHIFDNLDNLDFLQEKFDELREKEIDGNITEFETILLYEIIEKQILKFPNPHLPLDHDEAIKAVKKFQTIEKQLKRRHKNRN